MPKTIHAAAMAAVLPLAACNGRVNLDVTDAAVDQLSKVYVQFDSVTLKPAAAGAVTVTLNPPLTIDLLALEGGGTSRLLDNKQLSDGSYDSLSLGVNADGSGKDSYVVLSDGTTKAPLLISSTAGLTLNGGFRVDKDGTRNYVIDFNLRKSVLDPLTGTTAYRLAPKLRLVDRDASGAIAGSVAGAGAAGCSPAVYVYAGSGATLGDEGSAHAPLTSALVKAQATTPVTYTYKIAFLDPGAYTLATTCQADADSPEIADESIGLSNATEVQVQKGATATVNF